MSWVILPRVLIFTRSLDCMACLVSISEKIDFLRAIGGSQEVILIYQLTVSVAGRRNRD